MATSFLSSPADTGYMKIALAEAEKALAVDEIPVGAVLVRENEVIAQAHNRRELDQDPTAHAEILALKAAAKKLGRWRLSDCTLYVTLEPCPMCAGALVMARIGRLIYGASDYKSGAVESLFNIPGHPKLNHHIPVTAGIEEEACRNILQTFFKKKRQATSQKE
jgi:Cytosine/adenosine deaminases